MALDENRVAFPITRSERAYEVWFMGRHSNVGGGFEDPGLSDMTLAWMVAKARQSSLTFDRRRLAGLAPNPWGKMPPQGGRPSNRVVYEGDRAHCSVIRDRYPEVDWARVKRVG